LITIILGKMPRRGGMPPIERILKRRNIFVILLETSEGIEPIESIEYDQKNLTIEKIIMV